MAGIATEYVLAKEVLQLSYAPIGSDVAAVGTFVAGSTSLPATGSGAASKELLFLADKPSARAMELHGQKWNALGRDANGQPNGTGPAEKPPAPRQSRPPAPGVAAKSNFLSVKKGGDTIAATDVVVKSKNKIECKYAIPAGAALGQWNIEVTNPAVDDDGDGTLEAAKSSNTDKTFDVTD